MWGWVGLGQVGSCGQTAPITQEDSTQPLPFAGLAWPQKVWCPWFQGPASCPQLSAACSGPQTASLPADLTDHSVETRQEAASSPGSLEEGLCPPESHGLAPYLPVREQGSYHLSSDSRCGLSLDGHTLLCDLAR